MPWEWGWGPLVFLGFVLIASLWWDNRRKQRGGGFLPGRGIVFVPFQPPPGSGIIRSWLFC